jgi:hypothetical protein
VPGELSAACGPHCIDGWCCDRQDGRPSPPEPPQELVDRLVALEAEVREVERARSAVPPVYPVGVFLCLLPPEQRRERLGMQVAENARRRLSGE